jgi:hypothetical protein
MKHIVLALAILTASCAPVADVIKDAPAKVDSAVAKLKAVVNFVRSDIEPYAQTAVKLCQMDSPVCKDLDAAAGILVQALVQADQAIADYQAGKVALDHVLEIVKKAVDVAEDYARAVLAAHARATADSAGAGGRDAGSGGAGGSDDADAGV